MDRALQESTDSLAKIARPPERRETGRRPQYPVSPKDKEPNLKVQGALKSCEAKGQRQLCCGEKVAKKTPERDLESLDIVLRTHTHTHRFTHKHHDTKRVTRRAVDKCPDHSKISTFEGLTVLYRYLIHLNPNVYATFVPSVDTEHTWHWDLFVCLQLRVK